MIPQNSPLNSEILVLEDEWLLAYDCVNEFRSRGQSAIAAGSAVDAFGLMRTRVICGAVIDVNLHGEQTYALADIMIKKAIPFVFYTGYPRADLPERFSATPVLEKPSPASTVADRLLSLMRCG